MMQGAPADADVLRQRLAAKARVLGSSGRNPTFGYGLVQASTGCGTVASAEWAQTTPWIVVPALNPRLRPLVEPKMHEIVPIACNEK
jgi:hypothetical protein